MRRILGLDPLLLLGTTVLVGAAVTAACGSDGDPSTFVDPNASSGGFGSSSDGLGNNDGGGPLGPQVAIESLRIEPADAVLTIAPSASATLTYKVFAKMKGSSVEEDITSRSVFYVPDQWLVGGFPLDGSPTFTTRLPATPSDPPQRGGLVTVRAQAANSDGSIATAFTTLTVKLTATSVSQPGASPAIPANPATSFTGTVDAARAPRIVYPNDGVMMPPNLRRLDVHFDRGSNNDLFELRFVGANSDVTYYARCGGGTGYQGNACGFELDQAAYAFIAATNNGSSVKLKIRGVNEANAATYGESGEITIHFAQSNVEGGLYYWNVSGESIMRVDFGNPNANVEAFLVPGQNGLPGTCVGCHTLSRDGTKLVASLGGQQDGRLVYLNDLSKAPGAAGWLTQNGATTGAPAENRIQFASFNPSGSEYVAVYGDNATSPNNSTKPSDLDKNKLWFHDGATGLRKTSKQLAWKPNHPDWSPDGKLIAVTHVGNANTTTQRPTRGSIELLEIAGATWGDPKVLVPPATDKNFYNPNFVPDSSFLLFSESICPTGSPDNGQCDADADPSARTWAVQPKPGAATPVLLGNANKPGVADNGQTNLGDTYPRSAPFKTPHKGGTLMWATIASRRAPGLKTKVGAQLLWMFAIDPAKVLAGQDGSYPAFYLPFQDFATSNHIGQWTEKIVGGNAPPPPPPPPPPAPPPAPR